MYGFIFGAAGTGKTTYIYRYLAQEAEKHPEKQYYLFVPEQNTLKAQQELCRYGKTHGLLNLDVLSFQLLSWRVMEELGIRRPDILDEMSKSMLLRASLRKVSDRLVLYGGKADRPGFIAQLKSAFSEFYQYDMTPEKLLEIRNRTKNPMLGAKLSDLREIFLAFQESLGERSAVAEEIPLILLRNIFRSELLSGAEVIFDGYTGFTPVQLRIIDAIMTQAESLRFSLTVSREARPYQRDLSLGAETDLFWLSKETVAKLCTLGEKNGLKRMEDLWFEESHCRPEIRIRQARDPREEVRILTDSIDALVRKEGFRYREIAVAVSELGEYRLLLKEALQEAGIPFFMDDKTDGGKSVLAEFLRAALAVLAESWSSGAVLRYLRNPLVQKDRELTDLLDNYVRGRGIRGRKAFLEEWDRSVRGMEDLNLKKLNEYKAEALGPLLTLGERMGKGSHTVAERLRALTEHLEESGAARALEAFCRELEEEGFLREAEENRRFYELILTLFLRMESHLGEERLSLKDFVGILEAGFGELKAGTIPEVMDRVVAGDLKRSRFDDIRALFILGVNDGKIPSTVSGGGILTDLERQEILAGGIGELAPADRQDSCIQRFYLYLVMGKPRDRLFLSYGKNDLQGKPMKPSEVIRELQEEARDRGRELPLEEPGEDEIHSEGEALLYLAEAFSQGNYGDRKARTLYNHFRRKGQQAPALDPERLLEASVFRYRGGKLSREAAAVLYGERLYGSVTRLEQYARCPYAHFLRYGLRLMERQEFEVAALDIGNMYHNAIDLAFRSLQAARKELSELTGEELRSLSEECVRRAAEEYNNRVMQSSARNRYLLSRVRRITGRTLWALQAQLRKGDFRLYGCELPFRLDTEGMSLHGRIDRVDISEDSSRVYVKVIDYKSGRTRFDLSLIQGGLQLQLAAYMDVALERAEADFAGKGKEVLPAGLFYYHIDDPITGYEAGADREAVEKSLLRKLRMNGLAAEEPESLARLDRELENGGTVESDVIPVKLKNGEIDRRSSAAAPEELLRRLSRYASDRMRGMSREILGGNISAHPFRRGMETGCDYCPYHSVCGFDKKLPGFSCRNIRTVSKDSFSFDTGEEKDRKETGDQS